MQLVVQLDEHGQIQVFGPVENKVLCYGLLACAHDAIKDHTDKKGQPKIVPPTNGDLLSIRRNGG